MSNLPESNEYKSGIYQLETTDPVVAGPEGISNLQAKQLTNRTAWLKQQVDLLISELGELSVSDVSGLQTALAGKLPISSYTAADVLAKLSTIMSINDVPGLQTALAGKLSSSDYTATDVLAKLLTVNGHGMGIDANTVRGLNADFSRSLKRNGYQRLPGGLIIQWGAGTAGAFNNSFGYKNTLPITFPNTGFFATAMPYGLASVHTDIRCIAISTTGVSFHSTIPYNNTTVRYVAIGH